MLLLSLLSLNIDQSKINLEGDNRHMLTVQNDTSLSLR